MSTAFFIFLFLLIRILILLLSTPGGRSPRRRATVRPVDGLGVLEKMYRNDFRRMAFPYRTDREFAAQLRQFYDAYRELPGAEKELFYEFLRRIVHRDDLLNGLTCLWSSQVLPFLEAVAYWRSRRPRRNLYNWRPGRVNALPDLMKSMATHLFEAYEVPPGLRNHWYNWKQDTGFEQFLAGYREAPSPGGTLFRLYFRLTDGGSLREADFIAYRFSRREAHFFGEAPAYLPARSAFWWAHCRAAGCSFAMAETLTNQSLEFEQFRFWRKFIRWLAARNEPAPSSQELYDLILLIRLVRFGSGYLAEQEAYRNYAGRYPGFKLAHRTPTSLLRWLNEEVAPEYPTPKGLTDAYVLAREGNCRVELLRLRNRLELREEGDAMGHCVGDFGYDQACLEGQTVIWSLRRVFPDGGIERLLTVEVEGSVLAETAAPPEQEADPAHLELVNDWLREEAQRPNTQALPAATV